MVSWHEVAADFEADGSLRDIVVIDATEADWQLVFEWLRATQPELGYLRENDPAPLPTSFTQVHAGPDPRPAHFTFGIGGIQVVWHCFAPDDAEFTIAPGDVDGDDRLRVLLDFLRELGQRTGRHVMLTPEGWDQLAILSYDPGADLFRYHPLATS